MLARKMHEICGFVIEFQLSLSLSLSKYARTRYACTFAIPAAVVCVLKGDPRHPGHNTYYHNDQISIQHYTVLCTFKKLGAMVAVSLFGSLYELSCNARSYDDRPIGVKANLKLFLQI